MNLKIFLARRISKRLTHEARVHRRALRDHLRQETPRIRKLEFRSRGLRLYAAWVAKGTLNVIPAHAEGWRQTALPQAAREIDSKTAARLNQASTAFQLRRQRPEWIDLNGSRSCATPTKPVSPSCSPYLRRRKTRRSLRTHNEHEQESTNHFQGRARDLLPSARDRFQVNDFLFCH
jgi:hypothetical protein